MGSDQGKTNVEIVAQGWRDAADRARRKAETIRSDPSLSAEDREQAHKGLLEAAKKCEEHARWWISGEGPPP